MSVVIAITILMIIALAIVESAAWLAHAIAHRRH
jgi:hypothetical protein